MVPEQSEEREPCSSVEPTGRKDTVSIPWSLVLLEVAERELSHERRWYHVIRHHVLRNKGVVSFFVETFPQEEDDEMAEALVLQSDFGVSDGAVSAMYGVAHSINPEIRIFDLTHDIPPFHIWEASYRLLQTVPYWTEQTVFVSVVDPGVGSRRKSVVARTRTNQYIITPDNGTLTHLWQAGYIAEVRQLDDRRHRLPRMGESYTFHGRDIFAFTGARLSSHVITFEEVGPLLPTEELVLLDRTPASSSDIGVTGIVEILDVRFGNVWTNIPVALVRQTGLDIGSHVKVRVSYRDRIVYEQTLLFGHSFADVPVGSGVVYINSLDQIALALNQGSFAHAFEVGIGNDWSVSVQHIKGGDRT